MIHPNILPQNNLDMFGYQAWFNTSLKDFCRYFLKSYAQYLE